jgi:hypothetical protein
MLTVGKASYQMRMSVSSFTKVQATTSVPTVDHKRTSPVATYRCDALSFLCDSSSSLTDVTVIDRRVFFFSQVISGRFQFQDSTASDGMMINEWWKTGKDLEGSGCGLTRVLSRHLSGETEDKTTINLSQRVSRPWFLPSASRIQVYSVNCRPSCSVWKT